MSDQETEGKQQDTSLLRMNAIQRFYQNLEEEDPDGNVIPLKMQASQEFKAALNKIVEGLLYDGVDRARKAGRKMLQPEDLFDSSAEEAPIDT
jgi:histone H3/H4